MEFMLFILFVKISYFHIFQTKDAFAHSEVSQKGNMDLGRVSYLTRSRSRSVLELSISLFLANPTLVHWFLIGYYKHLCLSKSKQVDDYIVMASYQFYSLQSSF